MEQTVDDCMKLMRLALGRRNINDEDSDDATMLSYISNFAELSMASDVKLFEQFGTLEFYIYATATDGVYTFNEVDADSQFINIASEAYISLTDPVDSSTTWSRLNIYQDPGEFYSRWGVNNKALLTAGFPTDMLFYGNEFVFRTIPDDTYTVYIYGYKINEAFSDINELLPFDYWMRYLAYGAAVDYARDFRYEIEDLTKLNNSFAHERKLLLARTHNQQKLSRCSPSF